MKEQIDALARLMLETFRGRTDRIGITSPRDLRRNIVGGTSVRVSHEGDILKNLVLHISGEKRVAFYNLVSANSCTWAVVEFLPRPGGPQGAPAVDSRAFLEELRLLEIAAYREVGKSGPSHYQVWIFFSENLMARRVRSLLLGALKKRSQDSQVEVYPRQDVTDGVGNYVWLPLFGGRDKWTSGPGRDVEECFGIREGCTLFVDDDGKPHPSQPNFILGIQRSSLDTVEKAILTLSSAREAAAQHVERGGGEVEVQPPADPAALSYLLRKCRKISNLYGVQRREGLPYQDWFKVVSVLVALGDVGVEEAIAFSKMGPGYRQGSDEEGVRQMRRRNQEEGERPAACAEFPCFLGCFEGKPLIRWTGGQWREDVSTPRESWPPPSPVWFVKQYYFEQQRTPAVQAREQAQPGTADPREGSTEKDAPLPVLGFGRSPGKGEGLNRLLGGGLQRGEMVLLEGRSGIGKTAFALQMADGIAADNVARRERGDGAVAVLYVSLVEGRRHLKLKTLARLTGIEAAVLRRGGELGGELAGRLQAAQAEVQRFTGYLAHIDLSSHTRDTMKCSDILEYLADRKKVLDAETALIVVDPIELLYTGRERLDAHVETRAARATEELAVLALRENVAVVALTSGELSEKDRLPAATVLSLRAEEDLGAAPGATGLAEPLENAASALERARAHLAEAAAPGISLEGSNLAVLVPLKLRWAPPSYPVYRHARAFHRFWEIPAS